MAITTTAVDKLRAGRITLGVSQSKLARLSGVSRFKICTFELGSASLTQDEHRRITSALNAEAGRLCLAAAQVTLSKLELTEGE